MSLIYEDDDTKVDIPFDEPDEDDTDLEGEVDLSDLDDGSVDDDNDNLSNIIDPPENSDNAEDEEPTISRDAADSTEVIDKRKEDSNTDDFENNNVEDEVSESLDKLVEEFASTIPGFFDDIPRVLGESNAAEWQWRTLPNGVHIAFDKKGNCVAGPGSVKGLFNAKKKKAAKSASNKRYYQKNKEIIKAKRNAKRNASKSGPLVASMNYEMIRDDKGRTIKYMGESIYLRDSDTDRQSKLEAFITECNNKYCKECGKSECSRTNKKSKRSKKDPKELEVINSLLNKYVKSQAPELAEAISNYVDESDTIRVIKDGTSFNIILDREAVHDINELSGSLLYYNNVPRKGVLKASLSNGTYVSLHEGTRNYDIKNSEINIRVSI